MNLPDWLHCNSCHMFNIKPENPITIGECGCACCCKCLDANPKLFQTQNITSAKIIDVEKCPACSSPETLFVAILDSVPQVLESTMNPFEQTIANLQDVYKFQQRNSSDLLAYLKNTCGIMQVRLREYTEAYQESQNLLKDANDRIIVLERQIMGTRQGFAKPSATENAIIDTPRTQSLSGSRFSLRPSSQSSSRSSGSSFKPYLGKRKENNPNPGLSHFETPIKSNFNKRPNSLSNPNPRFVSNSGLRSDSFGVHSTPSISHSARKSEQFIVRSSSSSGFGRAPPQNTPRRRMPY